MSPFVEVVQAVVRHELTSVRQPALGVVTALHPHADAGDDLNDEVDVRLQHEDLVLVRVPVAVAQPGSAAALKTGDLVLVHFLGGDLQQALVTACFHTGEDRPPVHPEGELVVEQRVAADGTRNQIRFAADGGVHLARDLAEDGTPKASVELTAAGDVVVVAAAAVTIRCKTLTVEGDLVVDGGDLTVKDGVAVLAKGGTHTEVAGNTISGKVGGAP